MHFQHFEILYFLQGILTIINGTPVPACDSEIYCHGDVLDTVQMARIYEDSKHFVDMPMTVPQDAVLANYDAMIKNTGANPSKQNIQNFVDDNFLPPGDEFEEWIPSDWTNKPSFTNNIQDEEFRKWALQLNKVWLDLGRKIKNDVSLNPDLYSMMYAHNPLVVPGGRFREFYYWDSFWVIKGMLLCEMKDTVKGMLQNFVDLVEHIGFVPNGGRIYYKRRSQPPLLTAMVLEYWKSTGDSDFIKIILPILEKEYSFWMSNRTVEVNIDSDNKIILNRYATEINQPRPESYYEDKTLISDLSKSDGQKLMTHVASAAESGWDFSSRWTGEGLSDVSNENLLSSMVTTSIIPVDLNSFLALTERALAELNAEIGDKDKADLYNSLYQSRTGAMEKLLWSEQEGSYFDYNMETQNLNRQFYLSNAVPLWVKCFGNNVNTAQRESAIYNYLKKENVLGFPGGIPTSLLETGQQWDFPNAWAPIVHMVIEGMGSSQVEALVSEGENQAIKWLRSNYEAYNKTGYMYEKYDVRTSGGNPGEGGEYEVQLGFGWSNGVVLDFLNTYAQSATVHNSATETPLTTTSSTSKMPTTMVALLLVTLIVVLVL